MAARHRRRHEPYTYTLDFGDHTTSETGSWSGVGSHPHGFHDYQQGGDFQVGGQVRDAAGQTQSCALAYSAPGSDLRLRCAATPTTGTLPLTVTFDDTRREGCIGPCTVTWHFGDGQSEQAGHAVHTYEVPGPSLESVYAAFAELRDSTDRVDICRMPIQVLAGPGGPPPTTNHPPSIDGLQSSPATIVAGQSSTLTGTTSDPDAGDVVSWELTVLGNGAGNVSPTNGTGPILATYTSSLLLLGARRHPSDRGGQPRRAGSYSSFGVFVNAATVNHPPTILSFTATPATIFLGGPPTQLSGTATDPDNDPLHWAVTLDATSTVNGTFTPLSGTGAISATFSPAATPNNTGTAVLRLNVADPSGALDTRTVTVNVVLGPQ